jgi:hypothetical protein
MPTPIEINMREYLAAHGKEPRGYGSWWFQLLDGEYRYQDAYGRAVAKARKEMKRQCQRFGISSPPAVLLLP